MDPIPLGKVTIYMASHPNRGTSESERGHWGTVCQDNRYKPGHRGSCVPYHGLRFYGT